jgi:hypothetical protein
MDVQFGLAQDREFGDRVGVVALVGAADEGGLEAEHTNDFGLAGQE